MGTLRRLHGIQGGGPPSAHRERERCLDAAAQIIGRVEGVDPVTARADLRATAVRFRTSEDEIARGVLLFHTD